MKNLQGKVALVTGASKGIGAAIARELAARGAAVAVNYSGSKAGAEKVVAEIKAAGGKAIAVQANLADPDAIGPLVEDRRDELARSTSWSTTPASTSSARSKGHAGALPQAVQRERAGPAADHAGGVEALRSQGRQHHQHRFGGGRRRSPAARFTAPPRARSNSITVALAKELGPKKIRVNAAQSRHDRDRRHACGRIHRQRLPEKDRKRKHRWAASASLATLQPLQRHSLFGRFSVAERTDHLRSGRLSRVNDGSPEGLEIEGCALWSR